jgi:hypothetical protein
MILGGGPKIQPKMTFLGSVYRKFMFEHLKGNRSLAQDDCGTSSSALHPNFNRLRPKKYEAGLLKFVFKDFLIQGIESENF